jgi:ketosteroid isomerase-like protein
VPVRQRARGEGSGVEVEIRIGHLWTVRDGRIARLDVFAARDDALRAADEAST